MAIILLTKPEFQILQEYVVPSSTYQIYTKLNNHHGDQFGKGKITTPGRIRAAKIQITDPREYPELINNITLALWGDAGYLKIRNAHEGKTT